MDAPRNIIDAFRGFSSVRVGVLGDLMVDRFIYGDAERLSPEAPVPVVRIRRRQTQPGGAANVGNNVLSMGGRLALFGVLGRDEAGEEMLAMLSSERAQIDGVLLLDDRPSTVKTRIVARSQHLLRYDEEDTAPIAAAVQDRLAAALTAAIGAIDVFVISDYDKGVISPRLASAIVEVCSAAGIPLLVDPKPANIDLFHGADLIKPNLGEALRLIGWEKEATTADMQQITARIRERVEAKNIAVTGGARGIFLSTEDGAFHHLPGQPREVFDVAGAGDSTLAAMALARGAGADWVSACHIGNLAGSIAVGHLGVAAVTVAELAAELEARDGHA